MQIVLEQGSVDESLLQLIFMLVCSPNRYACNGVFNQLQVFQYFRQIPKFWGEASFKGCVICPRGWVREGCVPPPVRSLEVQPFLITKLIS